MQQKLTDTMSSFKSKTGTSGYLSLLPPLTVFISFLLKVEITLVFISALLIS